MLKTQILPWALLKPGLRNKLLPSLLLVTYFCIAFSILNCKSESASWYEMELSLLKRLLLFPIIHVKP